MRCSCRILDRRSLAEDGASGRRVHEPRPGDLVRCGRGYGATFWSWHAATAQRRAPAKSLGQRSVASVTADDNDPFAAALISQLPALRRYATVLAGNAADADDLVHDCIERALAEANGLEDLGKIGGWLRTILHNQFIDRLRRGKRAGAHVELSVVENSLDRALQPRDFATKMDFEKAFANMSFEHRQIVLMVVLEGLSYRDVARELGIPVGTVMSRLARAREQLRPAMGGARDVDETP